jgi:hypothetical protein
LEELTRKVDEGKLDTKKRSKSVICNMMNLKRISNYDAPQKIPPHKKRSCFNQLPSFFTFRFKYL